MKVVVNLNNQKESTIHTEVTKTYVDGVFFCVDEPDGLFKYYMSNIWLIVESEESKEASE